MMRAFSVIVVLGFLLSSPGCISKGNPNIRHRSLFKELYDAAQANFDAVNKSGEVQDAAKNEVWVDERIGSSPTRSSTAPQYNRLTNVYEYEEYIAIISWMFGGAWQDKWTIEADFDLGKKSAIVGARRHFVGDPESDAATNGTPAP
jgi:hypothetical protein